MDVVSNCWTKTMLVNNWINKTIGQASEEWEVWNMGE